MERSDETDEMMSAASAALGAADSTMTNGFPESPGGDERLYDPVAVGDGGDDPGGLYDPAGEGDYEDAYQYMDPVAEGEEDDGMQGSTSKRIIALYKEAERRKVNKEMIRRQEAEAMSFMPRLTSKYRPPNSDGNASSTAESEPPAVALPVSERLYHHAMTRNAQLKLKQEQQGREFSFKPTVLGTLHRPEHTNGVNGSQNGSETYTDNGSSASGYGSEYPNPNHEGPHDPAMISRHELLYQHGKLRNDKRKVRDMARVAQEEEEKERQREKDVSAPTVDIRSNKAHSPHRTEALYKEAERRRLRAAQARVKEEQSLSFQPRLVKQGARTSRAPTPPPAPAPSSLAKPRSTNGSRSSGSAPSSPPSGRGLRSGSEGAPVASGPSGGTTGAAEAASAAMMAALPPGGGSPKGAKGTIVKPKAWTPANSRARPTPGGTPGRVGTGLTGTTPPPTPPRYLQNYLQGSGGATVSREQVLAGTSPGGAGDQGSQVELGYANGIAGTVDGGAGSADRFSQLHHDANVRKARLSNRRAERVAEEQGHRFTPNIEESQRIRNAIPLENNQRFEVLFAEAKEREAKIRALREDEELSFKTLSQKEAKQAIDKNSRKIVAKNQAKGLLEPDAVERLYTRPIAEQRKRDLKREEVKEKHALKGCKTRSGFFKPDLQASTSGKTGNSVVRDATTSSQPRHQQMYEKAAVAKKKKDEKKKKFEDQELEKCTFAPKTNSSRRSGSKQRGGSQPRSNSNNRVMAPSPVPPPPPPLPAPTSTQADANPAEGTAALPTKLGDAAVWRRHMLQAGEQQQRQANRAAGKALTADAGNIQSAASGDSSPGRRSNSASDLDSPQHRDSPTPSGYSASSFAPTASEVEDDSPKNRVLNVMQHRRRQRAVSANNNERNSRFERMYRAGRESVSNSRTRPEGNSYLPAECTFEPDTNHSHGHKKRKPKVAGSATAVGNSPTSSTMSRSDPAAWRLWSTGAAGVPTSPGNNDRDSSFGADSSHLNVSAEAGAELEGTERLEFGQVPHASAVQGSTRTPQVVGLVESARQKVDDRNPRWSRRLGVDSQIPGAAVVKAGRRTQDLKAERMATNERRQRRSGSQGAGGVGRAGSVGRGSPGRSTGARSPALSRSGSSNRIEELYQAGVDKLNTQKANKDRPLPLDPRIAEQCTFKPHFSTAGHVNRSPSPPRSPPREAAPVASVEVGTGVGQGYVNLNLNSAIGINEHGHTAGDRGFSPPQPRGSRPISRSSSRNGSWNNLQNLGKEGNGRGNSASDSLERNEPKANGTGRASSNDRWSAPPSTGAGAGTGTWTESLRASTKLLPQNERDRRLAEMVARAREGHNFRTAQLKFVKDRMQAMGGYGTAKSSGQEAAATSVPSVVPSGTASLQGLEKGGDEWYIPNEEWHDEDIAEDVEEAERQRQQEDKEDLEREMSNTNDVDILELVDTAESLAEVHRDEEAMNMIEAFLTINSTARDELASLQLQARAWALKSSLLASKQRYDEAYVHMLHATQLDPTNRRFAASLVDLANIRDASHFFSRGQGGERGATEQQHGLGQGQEQQQQHDACDEDEWVEVERDDVKRERETEVEMEMERVDREIDRETMDAFTAMAVSTGRDAQAKRKRDQMDSEMTEAEVARARSEASFADVEEQVANWAQKAEQVHTSTAEMDAREEVRAARETKARARLEAKSKMESRSWAQAQADARARLERQSSEQVDRAIARAQEQAVAKAQAEADYHAQTSAAASAAAAAQEQGVAAMEAAAAQRIAERMDAAAEQERAFAKKQLQLEQAAQATAAIQQKQMEDMGARAQELVALHENKMEMVAQAQASAKALAEAQERDYREKVLKLEQQAADQAATQAAAMEKMAAKMFHAQAKMEQMMAQAEAKSQAQMRAMAQTDAQAQVLAEALAQAQAAQAEALADAEQMRRTSVVGGAEEEDELLELMGVKSTTGEDGAGKVADDGAVGGSEPGSPESFSAC